MSSWLWVRRSNQRASYSQLRLSGSWRASLYRTIKNALDLIKALMPRRRGFYLFSCSVTNSYTSYHCLTLYGHRLTKPERAICLGGVYLFMPRWHT
jgi:hypothetical protein